MLMNPRFLGTLVLGLAVMLLVGCGGGESITRYHATGEVQYDGKPVPAGNVFFTPSKGNDGPQGYAKIKDGKYDTRSGKGTTGGPMQVRIEGYDGQATDQKPLGKPVFTYDGKADLPKDEGKKDFNLTPKDVKKAVEGKPV